uniref:CRAL-TRIO domain-containing protein n=1 Tax=Chlamydomonas leiostraca TaxID=1034604 RepID=A0A7S0RLK1_9CHLO|mmetsp:Transcript_25614/g.65003  ORF Transcript_25614/g.65003 Transcript_25614/m.65003 type:complete len:318 (+) Transcript_25614:198-1151(+)|eukprot:CAMPEP_0202861726 /NCGR_PEP_ID=MMETSP1391-20130828/3033_1 /ASSEMBLY_ACC=CAM_ASM_000867 /TAXON_ID=1034604 /ORGANISM="Chlamydomonas leiostraca, Strain SAG 11-49" /LENGTH=317 /DNA_ID=CAMNT_0049541157 /DNA_START=191 /DNA_END=1144 /DNA_ORIENTATION=-
MVLQTEAEAFWYLPENLTAEQKAALESFKKHLTDEKLLLADHDDDCTLLRFLKARQWHQEPATLMYKNMVEWRAREKVDELYMDYEFPEFQELIEFYPHFYHKLDKFGRPVYIELLGQTDCTKMLTVASQERIMKYHIWTWERLKRLLFPACSRLAARPVMACTVVIDLAGLSLKNFTLTTKHLLGEVARIDQDYYPEHLGAMFIINTPYVFKVIWAVVNPLLEERTRRKITVLGYDYQETLKQAIPEDNLPTFLGGKSECAGAKHSSMGPWQQVEPCKSFSWVPVGGKRLPSGALSSLLSGGSLPEPGAPSPTKAA